MLTDNFVYKNKESVTELVIFFIFVISKFYIIHIINSIKKGTYTSSLFAKLFSFYYAAFFLKHIGKQIQAQINAETPQNNNAPFQPNLSTTIPVPKPESIAPT